MTRLAGVAVPLASLRTCRGGGIGEIFDLPLCFDWAVSAGQRLVALLPLGELAPGESSPYNALSTFALDPLYVSPGEIPELAGVAAAEASSDPSPLRIDRETERARKEPLFAEAFARFRHLPADCVRRRAFDAFASANADWLEEYALFRCLSEEQEFAFWRDWPVPLRRRSKAALERARKRLGDAIELRRYMQFVAEEQWWRIRESAKRAGVLLMGDLPFAPSANSAEVWSRPDLFDPARSVGAPPDEFSARGQRWGLPMFRWKRMRAERWRWFRSRFRRLADLYDLYRIDHVVGLFRTYAFRGEAPGAFDPRGERTQRAQGRALLEAALEASGAGSVVAEDLGVIPDFVRECLSELDVPGYKVFRWERDRAGVFVDPRQYPECSIATTGTHDTEPLAVWWRSLSEAERRDALAAPGVSTAEELSPEARKTLLGRLFSSPSRYVILPIQDFFGWTERVNLPATVGPENWSFRLPVAVEDLAADPRFAETTRWLRSSIDAAGRFRTMS